MPPTNEPPLPESSASSIFLTPRSLEQMEGFRVTHKTQVLTILFTDLVGSTDLQSKLGNIRGYEVDKTHKSLMREVLRSLDGQEVETAGDSFLVIFAVPSESVKFALHMQARMRKARETTPQIPGIRVGIHLGQVVVEHHETGAKAMDIYGLQVSTAARIMSLANGGQTLCSRTVFDDARAILTGEDFAGLSAVAWQNHGPYKFKGVEDSYDVCEVGEAGIAPLSAPPAGEKAWPSGRGEEEPGWRPAAGVVVPGTKWTLKERLGKEQNESGTKFRGEFGEVWKAWNPDLKAHRVFKLCFKRDRVSALKREARLLQQLQKHPHPNLVEVSDVTVGDRPPYYLQMEYVEGPSLAEWLATNPSLKERLEIVAQVADALDMVHAAGIYHRDVKPSNILLTHREDGALQAKLTDFGLGAADDAQLLQSIQMSRVDGVAGTWDYMAPELRKGQKACAQSDLYSLGVTLYQVVSGDLASPLTGDWEGTIPSEILREDIRRCVAGEASDRWRSAGELARALRSHDQRLRELQLEREHQKQAKRAQRMRLIAGLASAFAVVTLGLGGLAWYQRNVAAENERKATAERDKSQQLFAAGKKFADFTIYNLEPAIRNLAGSTPPRKMLVDQALVYLGNLKTIAGDDAALLRSIASAYLAVGGVQGNPRNANLGDAKGAMDSCLKSLEICQKLAAADPTNADIQRDLSDSYERLGDLQGYQDDLTGAMDSYLKSLEICQKLAAANPTNAEAQRKWACGYLDVGDLQLKQGDLTGAKESYSKSLAICEKLAAANPTNGDVQRDLSGSYQGLGDVQVKQNDLVGAMENHLKSLAISEKLAALDPTNAQAQRNLSIGHIMVGEGQAKQGDFKGAIESYRKSLAISEKLAASDPTNAQAQRDLTVSYDRIGDIQKKQGDFKGAIESYRKSLVISERLAASDPTFILVQQDLWGCYFLLARTSEKAGAPDAMDWWRKTYNQMIDMKKKGTLRQADERYLIQAAAKLGLSGSDANPASQNTRPPIQPATIPVMPHSMPAPMPRQDSKPPVDTTQNRQPSVPTETDTGQLKQLKQILTVTDDVEWTVLQPMIQKVLSLSNKRLDEKGYVTNAESLSTQQKKLLADLKLVVENETSSSADISDALKAFRTPNHVKLTRTAAVVVCRR